MRNLAAMMLVLGLLSFGTAADALPISACVANNGGNTQVCDLWESDSTGAPSEVSSPAANLAVKFDWIAQYVIVYDDIAKTIVSDVVKVDLQSAVLYSSGYSGFATILSDALASNYSSIVEDSSGFATFQQRFVFPGTDGCCDTFNVHSGDTPDPTPAPEPASIALVAAGLIAARVVRRRSHR